MIIITLLSVLIFGVVIIEIYLGYILYKKYQEEKIKNDLLAYPYIILDGDTFEL